MIKNLFLLTALCLVTLAVKAQDLSFEETVKYIKSKLPDSKIIYWPAVYAYNSSSGVFQDADKIKFEKNGTISSGSGGSDREFKFNIFDITQKKDAIVESANNIYIYIINGEGLTVRKYINIETTTPEEAKRLARAFKHLWDVCVKEVDPFAQPDEGEKKDKERDAVIADINKILTSQSAPYTKAFATSKDKELKKKENVTTYMYDKGALKYNKSTKTYSFSVIRSEFAYHMNMGDIVSRTNDYPENQKGFDFRGEIKYSQEDCYMYGLTGSACKILIVTVPYQNTAILIRIYTTGNASIDDLKSKFQMLHELDK